MVKVIGFVVIVGVLVFALRPTLWQQVAGVETTESENQELAETADEMFEQETQYAEGYEDSDFGAAFIADNEEMFPIEEQAPPPGAWQTMLDLKFDIRYDGKVDLVIHEPLYTPAIERLDGKIVELEGFIIPHDIASTSMDMSDDGQRFMFSAFPIASCFFCGGAGAESVAEAFPKEPISYTKQKITLKGKLKLNKIDPLGLPYILEDAEVVDVSF